MENNTTNPSLDNREKTNKSLKFERNKVDNYLDSEEQDVEHNVDEALDKKRAEIDRKLHKSRSDLDKSINNESGEVEKIILKEREYSDNAKTTARLDEDSIREVERTQKKIITENLLGSERKDTDAKLKDERSAIDSISRGQILSVKNAKNELTTRDQYLATVSHDLKNPLSAIALSVGVMKRSFYKDKVDKESLLKFFELIERNVGTMERLINDLLDVEQMVNGDIVLNLKKCDLGELLKEVQLSFEPAILNSGLTLELQPMDESIFANIDHDRIFQVLSNLIGNAIKFTPKNGLIKIGFEKNDNIISIIVSDNGPGIPEDKKELIFERFSQLNSNDRRGMGLGLFISKWIVESHNGEIFVNSKVDEGSSFTVTLPLYYTVH